ncbi:L-fuconolactonase [Litoreibacter ponti]|uniref:L-fuconolactonase n=1 Tax=Litoreibacter ponti TaxID=1510457 RepID=A0A2T6BEL7_9RHOB|nr:amidohydrolase family protein [Litoreibacter ponti]PTX54496.1 L-fuconolactonase [Litoreibacter ponti]
MKIDAHQHYWQPARGDYEWMPKDDPTLSRTYGPADLSATLDRAGIERTVLVQAAATVEETEYMLGLADATETIGAVVGWVDFEAADVADTLARLAGHPTFSGVRPMIQDIPDDDWMLRDDVQAGFRAVNDLGVTFDALGFPRHLKNFLTILTRYPDMRVVIDHCMKPDIANHTSESFQVWADGMSAIARETGAYCKLSGLMTEAGAEWTVDDLKPYAHHVLDVFGSDRVMWGSDWPVCRLSGEYERWLAAAQTLTEDLDAPARARVFGESAAEFYRISGD